MYLVMLFFFFLAIRFVLFFHDSNSTGLIYSRVLQNAKFCLFKMAVLVFLVYFKMSKSSPPLNMLCSLLLSLETPNTVLSVA